MTQVGRQLLWVLIDGLGDTSIPSLGHRSPLEAAATPTLDALASTPVPPPAASSQGQASSG